MTSASQPRPHRRIQLLPLLLMLALASCGPAPSQPNPAASVPTPAVSSSATIVSEPPTAAATAAPPQATAAPPQATAAIPATAAPTLASVPETLPQEIALIRPSGEVLLIGGEVQKQVAINSSYVADGGRNDATSCSDSLLAWSPDGHRLALPDGIRTLADDPNAPPAFAPILGGDFRWSRDGQRLAWLYGIDEHADAMVVAGPDGAEQRAFLVGHWGYTGRTEWSPDAQRVIAGRQQVPLSVADPNMLPPAWDADSGWGKDATWSPSGELLAWTRAETSTEVLIWDKTTQRTLANISAVGTDGGTETGATSRLRWLPDGSGLLLAVVWTEPDQQGIWRVDMNGKALRISPHQLCDLSADGKKVLARTAQGMIVVLDLSSGSESELEPGMSAAWRPAPRGSAPDAPLAAKSATLSLQSPPLQGESVTALQNLLTGLGYDVGAIDGIYGSGSETAVRAFQKERALSVDGIVGPDTWANLRSPTMTVLEQQRRLQALGYDVGTIDGISGPSTQAAREAFRDSNGLSSEANFVDISEALRSLTAQ